MKKIIDAYNSLSLILRISIGIVIGIIAGIFVPQLKCIGILGDLFVGALKAVAPVLVFALVSSSLVKGKSKLDGRFGMVYGVHTLRLNCRRNSKLYFSADNRSCPEGRNSSGSSRNKPGAKESSCKCDFKSN